MTIARTAAHKAIPVCLIAAGTAYTAYVILWTRLFDLSFRNSSNTTASVLFALFGGMAIGNRFPSSLAAGKVRNPLVTFGVLTATVALYSKLTPAIAGVAGRMYLSLVPALSEAPSLRGLLSFSLIIVCLALPSVILGGALVFSVKCFASGSTSAYDRAGHWYGYLALGAASGAIVTRYWMLPAAGIALTNNAFAAIGFIAGASAIVLGLVQAGDDSVSPQNHAEKDLVLPFKPQQQPTLLLATALSGAAFTCCLTVWTRSLKLITGPTTGSSSAVLVTVLAGIALGGIIFPSLRIRPSAGLFTVLQLFFSAFAVTLLIAFPLLPRLFLVLFTGYKEDYRLILLFQILLSSIVVLAPSIVAGMTYPCAVDFLARGSTGIGHRVGRFNSCWAWGACAGAIASGHVLLPVLGVRGVLIFAVGVSLLAAVLTSITHGLVNTRVAWFFLATALAFLALLPTWNHALMVSGPSLYPEEFYSTDELLGRIPAHRKWEILLLEEGSQSASAVVRTQAGHRFIAVDGRIEGGTLGADVESAIKLALIPMLLHPEPDRVAILGAGTGITTYTAARFDTPGRVDVAEADASAVKAQKTFSPGDLDAFRDPRTAITLLDGRSFLEAIGESYDVIICDAPEAWVSGAADLFTLEFYRSVRDRMAPGGVFCQRLRGLTLPQSILKMVFRTVLEVFPRTQLWEGGSRGDFFLVCPHGDWKTTGMEELENRLKLNIRLLEFMDSQGNQPIEALLSGFRVDTPELSALAGAGAFNTDDRNILLFEAAKGLYQPLPEKLLEQIQSPDGPPYPAFLSDPSFEIRENRIRMSSYLLRRDLPGMAMRYLAAIPSLIPPQPARSEDSLLAARLASGETLIEDFDGPPHIPFYILCGGYRPEGSLGAGTNLWAAYQEFCGRTSGVAAGEGRDGSDALVITSPVPPIPTAFHFPLEVEPHMTYDISFWMKSEGDASVEAGAGHMEYRAVLPYDSSITIDVHARNVTGGTIGAAVRGSSPWTRHTFSITTGPDTRMIHLQLFRLGEAAAGGASFDNLSIRKLGGTS